MANQNKLKAYVRYDGTGRVIAGGPILQRFKPKVGNWVEINANECCNEIPTTTTTTSTSTSTSTSTTTTTTTSVPLFSQDVNAAYTGGICDGSGNQLVFYYTNLTISIGSVFYTNPELTNLYTGQNGPYVRLYFNAQYNIVYINPNGEIATITPC